MKKTALILVLAFLSIGVIVFTGLNVFRPNNDSYTILQVGQERIYQKDYNYELQNTPSLVGIDQDVFIFDKLARDSIILQEASKKGILELDSTLFNNNEKDYENRLKAVKKVEESFVQSARDIEGTIIALWFFNNDVTGPEGYEASKKLTYDKIVELQKRVKSGQLTPDAAAQEIKEDSTLAVIDPAYKANALYNFRARADERIVFDDAFNKVIRELPEGAISDVYTLKAPTGAGNQSPREALHAFVVRRQSSTPDVGITTDINAWYQSIKNQYEIKKF